MFARVRELGGFEAPVAAKVPEVTLLFWVIKIVTTGVGEATSDYLGSVSRVLAVGLGALGFAAALWLQFRVRRYVAAVYWLAVSMVAVFGTVAADGLHKGLGVPYIASTLFYAICLTVVFYVWYRSEGTLSIHSIVTQRRETYYWLTVLMTFALGTAAGDLTADRHALGIPHVGDCVRRVDPVARNRLEMRRLNSVFAFWFAYVLTRPLGASIADWFGKRRTLSGLGYGDGRVALIGTALIVVLVGYLAIARNDIQRPGRNDIQRPGRDDVHAPDAASLDDPDIDSLRSLPATE